MGPGFLGLVYGLNVARDPKLFDSIQLQQSRQISQENGMDDGIPLTRSDFWMASIWCGLSMYWAFLLTTAFTQRLLQSYRAPNVVLRITLAHLLSWVLIGIIIQSRPATQPIRPWVIITFGQALLLFVIAYLPWFRTQMKLAGFPTISDRFVTNPLEDGFMGREINGQSVTRFLVLPLVVVGLCSWMLIITRGQHNPGQGYAQQGQWQQEHGGVNLQDPPAPIVKPVTPGNPNTFLIDRQQDDRMVICMIVLSSATPQGFRNRQLFRETTLKLLPSPRNKAVIVRHRFIIGEGITVNEQDIEQEHKMTGDLLIVNAPDTADGKSAKLYDAIKWADQLDFDYLVKTEDDVLVRMDTLSGELYKQGKKEFFWKGLVFKNVPNTRLDDMDLKEMPKFTDGTLTTLSRDIVALLAMPAPRYFVASSAQSLGIWLHGYGIKPVHDIRIQPGAFVCEEDLVAKHFDNEPSLASQPRDDPIQMVERINRIRAELKKNKDNRNFRTQISICDNRIQKRCAMCYSCQSRASNWKLMGFDCKPGGVIVGDKYRKPELTDAKQMEELLNRPPTGVSDELEMAQLKDYRPETRARIQAEQEAQRQAELERQQQNDEEESAGEDGEDGEDGEEEIEEGDGSEEGNGEEGSEESGAENEGDEPMTSQDEEEALDESEEEGQGQQQDAGHDDHDESEMPITDQEVDYLDRRHDDETPPSVANKKDKKSNGSSKKANNNKSKRRA